MVKKKSRKRNLIIEGFKKLDYLYSKLPETKGCFENLNKCKGKCCLYQNPQVFYVEFLNIWTYICKNWNIEDLLKIIELSVRTYVYNTPTKGCIFFDKEKYLCRIHNKRPFNCFFYGITPLEEFNKRYEKIKKLYKNNPDAIFMEQCNLIKAYSNGKEKIVSQEEIDNWWKELVEIEHYIGVKKKNINDEEEGSYRTFHDHILLKIMPHEVLIELEKIRMMKNINSKDIVIKTFIKLLKENIEKIKNAGKEKS